MQSQGAGQWAWGGLQDGSLKEREPRSLVRRPGSVVGGGRVGGDGLERA